MIAWLMQSAVLVVPIAVCIALVCRVFRPAPAVCHALWLLVLVKLVMPSLPVWKSRWIEEWFAATRTGSSSAHIIGTASLSPSTNTPLASWAGVTARVTGILVVETPTADSEMHSDAKAPAFVVRDDATPQVTRPLGAERRDLAVHGRAVSGFAWRSGLVLWVLGAFVSVVCHGRRVLRINRVMKLSIDSTDCVAHEVAVQCRRLRVPLPKVRQCTGLPCPMVIALPRATLLWPAGLKDRLNEAGQRAVVLHELAHLKRRDHLTAWLEVAVACLWWWHPVVWWARRELREYAELACDAWVVGQLPAERSGYAKALVDVCEFISLAKPATAPAVGMARGNRRSFERRLHMILRQRIAARMSLVAWIAVLAGGLLMLPGFSTGQEAAGTTAEPAAISEGGSSAVSNDRPATATPTVTPQASIVSATFAADAAAAEPATSFTPAVRATNDAATFDEKLRDELRVVSRDLAAARHQGALLESETANRAERVLGQLLKGFRKHGTSDEHVVLEAFTWILKRRPTENEQAAWSRRLKQDDAAIDKLIASLLHSSEFTDPSEPRPTGTIAAGLEYLQSRSEAIPSTDVPSARAGKKARVQTLFRVIYDMPNDKTEKLAKFLKENVLGEIEAHTEKDALVVTAEVGIQGRVAGIVSLMTGEPVVLDLRGGLPSFEGAIQAPGHHDPLTGATSYRPRPLTAHPVAPSTFTARPTERRELRTRTVYETDPTTGAVRPRTIIEEHVWPGEPAKNCEPTVEPGFTAPVETPKTPTAVNGDPAIGP
jgi:beta-lactamase regulating signal transducer with metallopeptidase domain